METQFSRKTVCIEGEPLELWSPTSWEFSCQPDDITRYIAGRRWDLVFNALCYLAGAVEEGAA